MTKVYGTSDDLVEFEGDITGEVSCFDCEPMIVFSDGTVLSIKLAVSGIWKVTTHRRGDLLEAVDVCDDPDADLYSDVAQFGYGLKWAFSSTEWERVS